MIKRVYYSDNTSFVFISSNTDNGCDKVANNYFNKRKINNYIKLSENVKIR